MTYTGEVSVGGDADVRTLPALSITKVAVDAKMANNCYLLRCSATGAQVLIDAADSGAVKPWWFPAGPNAYTAMAAAVRLAHGKGAAERLRALLDYLASSRT